MSLFGDGISRRTYENPNSGIRENFAGLCNPEYNSRNPESHKRLESRIQVPLTKTGIRQISTEVNALTPQFAVWLVPYACAQPYHPGSGSHGQLFRRYRGSSAWHCHRVNERGNPRIKDRLLYQNPESTAWNPEFGTNLEIPFPGTRFPFLCDHLSHATVCQFE